MLGYKIPVLWPGNDWYVADKSKPLARERRSRLRRSGRKRSQQRIKKRIQAPAAPTKAKGHSYPGALFGFGPESPKGGAAKKKEDPEAQTPKKRTRRKKKSSSRTAKKSKPAKPASQR
jgi:hypothetical protein